MDSGQGLVDILNVSLSNRNSSNFSSPVRRSSRSTGLDPIVRFRHQKFCFKIWCLKITDLLLAFTVFPAAVTISWRGIWQYLDVTLTSMPSGANIDDHPAQKWRSIWISLPVCLVLSFFLNAFQFHLSEALKSWFSHPGKAKSVLLFLVLKLTIAISLVLGVACWRGFWDLWDLMLYKINLLNNAEPKFQIAIIVFVLVNSFVLVCWPMQVSRSLLSSPLQVSHDGGIEDIFESPTLFNKKPPGFGRHEHDYFRDGVYAWNWYFFDIFASTFLVQFLAVTCWWGLWTLEDKTLGPGTSPLVFFYYLLIGYGFSSVAYALQFTVTKDIPTLPQKFWSEFVVALGVVGVVSLWKGIWDYSDVVLSPLIGIEDRATNLAVQTMLAYLVLFVFNQTSLAANRGVVIDCPETHEGRSQDLFDLNNFADSVSKNLFAANLSFVDETMPLLE